jgi:ATP-binding cassette subfamily B (MDR/TAP) protein 1
MIFCFSLLRSLGQATPDIAAFIRAKTAAYLIFEMIERDIVSKKTSKACRKLTKIDGHVQFINVCFTYPSRPDVVIFNNLYLEIPSGKVLALVGGSGSGKSTIISLIERFYEPISGQILLDKNDIKELDLKWLRQQIGLVNQEPALFATSIRENILYGKNDATPEELNRALELSNAHSFINNLPDGLDTQVIMLQQYLNINKLPKCFLIMCNNLKISLWLRLWKQRQSL